jgi:cytochrome c-type biogenesis protein CcmH/NrfG
LKPLYVSLSLLALTLIVYFQVHDFEFVNFDDRETILGNTHIRDGITLAGLAWAFTSAYAANWFPVTWISHMLDFQLFGLDSGWHHLVNVMIHAASVLLLFALLRRMTGRLWESAFVSFVFALHPLHVESVAWVSERKDVLSAFFWFLTTWFYVDYVDRPGLRRYLIALGVFCLGLMSKQMLVTLPFVLLLLDYWPLNRSKTTIMSRLVMEKAPYLTLSAVASLIAYKVQHAAGAVLSVDSIPIATRAANALISYVAYLGTFFWPVDLAMFYPYPPSLPVWQIAGSAAILVAISVLALRRPYLTVGWLWYLGTLVPVIGLVQVGLQARADRYTYIPMIGISIMLAWGMAEIIERRPGMRFSLEVVAAVFCVAWLALSWMQAQYWRNSVTLFEHAIASTNNNFIAHLNLGEVLAEQGRTNDALRHLYAAVEEKPEHADGHDTLGAVLGQLGRTDEAAAQFSQAIRIQPNDSEAHCNLGNVLLARGQFADAANEFQTAIRVTQDFTTAHFGLAGALLNLGQTDAAIAQFHETLRLDPNMAAARDGLGKALGLKQAQGAKQ